MNTSETTERVAKAIAWAHFDRKPWPGACPKADWLKVQSETHWKTFLPAAERVMACLIENGELSPMYA